MKIISLNVWGGRIMKPLKDFLKKHADTDIFCFQEVYHEADGKDLLWKNGQSFSANFNFLNDVAEVLKDYTCHYRPHLGDWWGLALFVKNGLPVISEGEVFVHKEKGYDMSREVLGHTAKNLQFLKTECGGVPFTILHMHGLWTGGGKGDTEERLLQSKNVVECIKKLKTEFVFCGDLNLLPDTKSLQMFTKELGCRDLIAEHSITSTRTSFYKKEPKFADYAFVSKGVVVEKFEVLPDEVSDHKALLMIVRAM